MGLLPFEKIERTVLEREDDPESKVSNPLFGKAPSQRSVEELLAQGILILDKPPGPTSHQTADYAKRVLGAKKAGHSGTLDPAVTGVLVVALNTATRISQALLTSGKEYVCHMRLHKEYSDEEIIAVLNLFVGKIRQLPPIKSAVKRQWRFRRIYYIDLLEIDKQDVLFVVGCQAGTYIRKLCHDIGEKLGSGAHMAELRRTKAGAFQEQDAIILQDLADAMHYYTEGDDSHIKKYLYPLEQGAAHLPKVWSYDSAIEALSQGVSLKVPGVAKAESDIQVDDLVGVYTLKDELVMIGNAKMISKDLVTKSKGVAVKPEQVFMKPGTYKKK